MANVGHVQQPQTDEPKGDGQQWMKKSCCRQPFRYGIDILSTRSNEKSKPISTGSDEKLKPGDHIGVWKGTFPFYKHHAIVAKPVDIQNTDTQSESEKSQTFGFKDLLET